MCPYDNLSDMYKGIIQIVIGMTTVLYVLGLFPYWIALLASLILVAHGFLHAGLYDSIKKMTHKAGNKKNHSNK